jgi:hypothetical protein
MKSEIKKYHHYELKQVQESLSPKNKKLIKDFLLFCGTTAGKSKLKNIERVMVKIADIFEKDLDKLTLEEIRKKARQLLDDLDDDDESVEERVLIGETRAILTSRKRFVLDIEEEN